MAVVDTSVPATPLLVARVPVAKKPEGIALTPNGTKLYVTHSQSDTVLAGTLDIRFELVE